MIFQGLFYEKYTLKVPDKKVKNKVGSVIDFGHFCFCPFFN